MLGEPTLVTASQPMTSFVPSTAAQSGSIMQTTIKSEISCKGIGLHTGLKISVSLHPAPADTGIVFQRTDRAGAAINATYDRVIDTRLSTVIATADDNTNRVATIEHLMAALSGAGVDNVFIRISGPEVPVLDGSAQEFLFLISCAGVAPLDTPRQHIEVLRRVRVTDGDAFAELRPSARKGLSLAMSIDFAAAAIGRQNYAMHLTPQSFEQEVGFCRTFTQRQEIEALHAAGLARGGSLDNAIVVDGDHVLNPAGLRHPQEFVRHKIMDAIGDLNLAGHQLQAGFVGHKSGHGLNNQLLRALFADASAWRILPQNAQASVKKVAIAA